MLKFIDNPPYRWKTVRVFISSTFRDMHAERDYLVKYVFPELREWCQQYKLYLVDIDLRWGVTAAEAESGKVLDIVLDQIDGSRPFFVCLLGNRYGWVPDKKEVSRKTREFYDRLEGKEDHSITHLEIRHAVLEPLRSLDALEEVPHAFFYFRDEDSLPSPDKLIDYSKKEKEEYRKTYFEANVNNADRLSELKQEIKKHYHDIGEKTGNVHEMDERIFIYHPVFDTTLLNPEDDKLKGRFITLSFKELGTKVLIDLKKAISLQFEKRIKIISDKIEQKYIEKEKDLHESFVENRTRLFIGRTELLDTLHNYVNSDSRKVMAVYGQPGSGKSALLAKFYRDYKYDENGYEIIQNVLFIPHFAGASPASCFLPNILRRFCEELKVAYELKDSIPMESDKLSETFRNFIGKVNGKVVILIDGLNQLDEAEHAHELNWLPSELPANVKIMASTIEGTTKEALVKKTDESLVVTPLTNGECREIIDKMPSVFCKTLDEKYIELLLKKEKTRNPLYLKVAIDELRVFGSFEKLEKKISALPSDIESLFIFVIERLEKDCTDKSGIIERLFCLLECSRFGLSSQEIKELMQDIDKQNIFQSILRQMRDYLIPRGELIDFFHRGFSKAIRQKYLINNKGVQWHRELADYFCSQPLMLEKPNVKAHADGDVPPERIPNRRKLQELPWQQTEGRLTEELISTLTSLDFIEAKCKADLRFELISDYSHAEILDPKYEESSRAEREHSVRIDRYVEELINHSRDPENHPSPEPPRSVAFETDETLRQKEAGWTHQEILQAWGHFVAHNITRIGGKEPIFQIAYNNSSSGPVTEQVEQSSQCGNFYKAPWIKLLNRPAFSPHPACQKVMVGKANRITSITISADGSKALAAGEYNLDVWNLFTGKHESTLAGSRSVSMTPDMRWAISGLGYHNPRGVCGLWDLATGECIRTLKMSKDDEVRSVAITPDGRLAVSGSFGGDKSLRLWDCNTGDCLLVLGEGIHRERLTTVLISNNAKYAIAAEERGGFHVWDLQKAKLLHTVGISTSPAISLDSNTVVAVYSTWRDGVLANSQIRILDLSTGTLKIAHDITHKNKDHGINGLTLSADGKYAVTTGWKGKLAIWDLQNGTCLKEIADPSCGHLVACAITPDCRIAVTGELGNAVRVWDLQGSIYTSASRQLNNIDLIRTSRKRYHALTGVVGFLGFHDYQPVGVWDIETQESKNQLNLGEDQGPVSALVPLPDEDYCIIGRDGSLQLWNITGKSPLSILPAHQSAFYHFQYGGGYGIYHLRVTADGSRALWSNGSTNINESAEILQCWDLRSGQAFETIVRHNGSGNEIAMTSDGRMAITTGGHLDNNLRVFDLESMMCIGVIETNKNTNIKGIMKISPDNCLCSYLGQIWNLKCKDQDKVKVRGGLFFPDGRMIFVEKGWLSIRDGGFYSLNDIKIQSRLFSPDGHAVAWHSGTAVGLYNFDSRQNLAWHGDTAKPCTAMAICWPYFLVGEGGVVNVYSFENMVQGPAIVTPVRLWLFGFYGQAGRWDNGITTVCEWCGRRFQTPAAVIDTIGQITSTAKLEHDSVPSLELPVEAWDEPKLISECPCCRRPLKYNPFLVDNRDRLEGLESIPLGGAKPREKATPVPDLSVWQGD